MLLCDIGNTSYHFYNKYRDFKKDTRVFNPASIKEKVFYICVNQRVSKKIAPLKNWTDLSNFIDRSKYYETMGIDRIAACQAIDNGVIIDAGSAITVDIVRDGVFEGGFISPGLKKMHQAYKNISPALDYNFNFNIDLTKLPKNTPDAISYGFLKILYSEVMSYDLDVYLTGGHADKFSMIFKDAKVDRLLLFKGMRKIIDTKNSTKFK